MDLTELQLPCKVYCSRLSPICASRLVGLGCKDGSVHVYPFGGYSRTVLLSGSSSPSTSIAFDSQQQHLAGGNNDGSVRLWDIPTEAIVRTFEGGHKSVVTGVDFHAHAEFFATCSRDAVIRVWDTRKNSYLQSYKGAAAPLCTAMFSPNGRWIASGCADGIVRLYDLSSGKELCQFRNHTGPITSICFHPEWYFLAASSSDGSASLWNLENFSKVFQSRALDIPVDAVHLFGKNIFVSAYNMLQVYQFGCTGAEPASVVQSPWNNIGDISYSSLMDEILFVEFSGSTATMGRVPLSSTGAAAAPVDAMNHQLEKPLLTGKESEVPKTSIPVLRVTHQRLQRTPSLMPISSQLQDSADSSIDDLLNSSVTVVSVLQQRLTHLRVLRSLWAQDNQQALMYLKELHVGSSDYGVIADFLGAMQNLRMKERITLNNLPDLLDVIMYALASDRENQLLAALKVLKSMSAKFRPKLDEARRLATTLRNGDKNPSNLTMEQYYELSAKFDAVATAVQKLGKRKGPVGEGIREVLNEIPTS